jgi:hypothetical protein
MQITQERLSAKAAKGLNKLLFFLGALALRKYIKPWQRSVLA